MCWSSTIESEPQEPSCSYYDATKEDENMFLNTFMEVETQENNELINNGNMWVVFFLQMNLMQ